MELELRGELPGSVTLGRSFALAELYSLSTEGPGLDGEMLLAWISRMLGCPGFVRGGPRIRP